MNGYGSHCEGCECLFLGKYGPFCCRGPEPTPILFLSSCPAVEVRCFPKAPQIVRKVVPVRVPESQTFLEGWA